MIQCIALILLPTFKFPECIKRMRKPMQTTVRSLISSRASFISRRLLILRNQTISALEFVLEPSLLLINLCYLNSFIKYLTKSGSILVLRNTSLGMKKENYIKKIVLKLYVLSAYQSSTCC